MRQRRIFKPSRTPRRFGRAALVGLVAAVGALAIGLGSPADLMGSAPRHQEWRTEPADIHVLDGETLRLGDRTLRLAGLDAPERGQRCTDVAGRLYDCGHAAATELARLVGERGVHCRFHGRDRFGRALAQCRAGEVELNAAMVEAGWALAHGAGLQPLEASARQARRGLWTGGFEPPAHWRRGG